MHRKRKNIPAAILTAATVFCLGISILLAAWKRLSPLIPDVSSETAATDTADFTEIPGNNNQGIAVAEYALQFSGTPYLWGGANLTEGVDCSGFVMGVYEYFGVSLPHSAMSDRSEGYAVESLEAAEPGDLICYAEPSHVAIYLGGGKIVHASSTLGVRVADVEYVEDAKIAAIRRLLPRGE